MDAPHKKLEWHYETLPVETKRALDFFSGEAWLHESGWYLAGGTALALQVGNRKSFDLDFFTQQKDFSENGLLSHFADTKDWSTTLEEKNTIYGELSGAKVSFIAYSGFIPKHEPLLHGQVKVLNPTDIAVMKVTAISQRGKKRDFFDLYWCAKNVEPLESTVRRLPEQYPSVAHDYHHILKSMVYFEDAESDPDPEIYFGASWGEVKDFFVKEVPAIASSVMNLHS